MRPRETYRAYLRNNRSHLAKSKKMFSKDVIQRLRGLWNLFPEIGFVNVEVRSAPWFARFFNRFTKRVSANGK